MTVDLLALGDWLRLHQVTHVAMESTGVLWRPVFNVLEEGHTLLLVNAQHIKAVPGREVRREVAKGTRSGGIAINNSFGAGRRYLPLAM
jgi:transposase